MKIENYGSGERCREVMRGLLELDGAGGMPPWLHRVILLPIPAARDGVHVTGTDKLVSEVLMDIEPGDFVAGYGIPDEDIEIIKAQGAEYFDAAEDEEFLSVNAHLTALGALGYILTNIKRIPSENVFGIVGYGRIGSRLSEMLMYLGAKIKVYTSKNATRLSLGECGIKTVYMERGCGCVPELEDVSVLINTAPTPLGATFSFGVPRGMTVIELASGNNFDGVEGVVRLPSIPDRAYPLSAGRAYLEAILRAIEGVAL